MDVISFTPQSAYIRWLFSMLNAYKHTVTSVYITSHTVQFTFLWSDQICILWQFTFIIMGGFTINTSVLWNHTHACIVAWQLVICQNGAGPLVSDQWTDEMTHPTSVCEVSKSWMHSSHFFDINYACPYTRCQDFPLWKKMDNYFSKLLLGHWTSS